MEPHVRTAQLADLASVERLLTSVDLTVAGVSEHLLRFLVAEDAGEIVACAGLEIYGPHALLRSVAVHPRNRNKGLGTFLVTRLVDQARRDGVRFVYLLTTTAEEYFRRLGFGPIGREDVDPALRQSAEFDERVCATARAMVLSIETGLRAPAGSHQTTPKTKA
jgi:amino-acid N-acetyltransferase